MTGRRVRVSSLVFAAATAIAVTGATAFACITPAGLNLSTAQGRPGDVVTISGTSWNASGSPDGVQIRWAAPDGPLLAQVMPTDDGKFTTSFKVPAAAAGFYSIVGVLRDATGNDAAGTPSRVLFEIQNPVATPVTQPPAPTITPTPNDGGSSFPLAIVIGLGAIGLVLFAGGFAAVARTRRTAHPQPQPARTK